MKTMEITFRGGAQVRVDCTEFTAKKDRISQAYTELSWTTPDNARRRLIGLCLHEVVCLVEVC